MIVIISEGTCQCCTGCHLHESPDKAGKICKYHVITCYKQHIPKMPQYGFSLFLILHGFHPYLTSGPGDRPQGSHQAAGRCHPDTSQHFESSLPAETKLNIIDIICYHFISLSNLMILRGQQPLIPLK